MNTSLLFNARVLTMDAGRPHAQAVAIRDGRIAAIGTGPEAARALDSGADRIAQRIDCRGGTLLPAFIDAHCHLLAYAASLRSVDCSAARSIAEIEAAIRDRADATPLDNTRMEPRWRLKIESDRPGASIWVNGRFHGRVPTDIEIRGRAGESVALEMHWRGGGAARTDLTLHPMMPKVWNPDV